MIRLNRATLDAQRGEQIVQTMLTARTQKRPFTPGGWVAILV